MVAKVPESYTGKFLAGVLGIEPPAPRRQKQSAGAGKVVAPRRKRK